MAYEHTLLKAAVLEALKHINGYYFGINTGVFKRGQRWIRSAPKGTPDILGFNGKGYFVAIELKVDPRGEKEQDEFRERIELTENGIYLKATSVEEVMEVLH